MPEIHIKFDMSKLSDRDIFPIPRAGLLIKPPGKYWNMNASYPVKCSLKSELVSCFNATSDGACIGLEFHGPLRGVIFVGASVFFWVFRPNEGVKPAIG